MFGNTTGGFYHKSLSNTEVKNLARHAMDERVHAVCYPKSLNEISKATSVADPHTENKDNDSKTAYLDFGTLVAKGRGGISTDSDFKGKGTVGVPVLKIVGSDLFKIRLSGTAFDNDELTLSYSVDGGASYATEAKFTMDNDHNIMEAFLDLTDVTAEEVYFTITCSTAVAEVAAAFIDKVPSALNPSYHYGNMPVLEIEKISR